MKFAYLIMAHDNKEQLTKLLQLLDCEENDIYLHIDKKSEVCNLQNLHNCLHRASLHIYSRYKVYWGDISQTRCELFLIGQAIQKYHDYYHLLSGHDLPIKSDKYITDFFDKNYGKEFIHFESNEVKVVRYHFFSSIIGRVKNQVIKKILIKGENVLLYIQNKLRIKKKLYKGANWFSITHDLAKELINNQEKLLSKIRFIKSSDEYILQTYICESGKKNSIFCLDANSYYSIMRDIDWERGCPYIWRKEDYFALMDSPFLYARKFDENVDNEIIEMITAHIQKANRGVTEKKGIDNENISY